MWAIEFGEPPAGRRSYRLLERFQPGLFAQLVVVPLFRDHRILSQVAGHGMAVIKGLPPLVVDEDDLVWFADALDTTIARGGAACRAAIAGFALGAAGVRCVPFSASERRSSRLSRGAAVVDRHDARLRAHARRRRPGRSARANSPNAASESRGRRRGFPSGSSAATCITAGWFSPLPACAGIAATIGVVGLAS